jgi:hypothetical protein
MVKLSGNEQHAHTIPHQSPSKCALLQGVSASNVPLYQFCIKCFILHAKDRSLQALQNMVEIRV